MCSFTGGYIEVSMSFPGTPIAQGYWPGAWSPSSLIRTSERVLTFPNSYGKPGQGWIRGYKPWVHYFALAHADHRADLFVSVWPYSYDACVRLYTPSFYLHGLTRSSFARTSALCRTKRSLNRPRSVGQLTDICSFKVTLKARLLLPRSKADRRTTVGSLATYVAQLARRRRCR